MINNRYSKKQLLKSFKSGGEFSIEIAYYKKHFIQFVLRTCLSELFK